MTVTVEQNKKLDSNYKAGVRWARNHAKEYEIERLAEYVDSENAFESHSLVAFSGAEEMAIAVCDAGEDPCRREIATDFWTDAGYPSVPDDAAAELFASGRLCGLRKATRAGSGSLHCPWRVSLLQLGINSKLGFAERPAVLALLVAGVRVCAPLGGLVTTRLRLLIELDWCFGATKRVRPA